MAVCPTETLLQMQDSSAVPAFITIDSGGLVSMTPTITDAVGVYNLNVVNRLSIDTAIQVTNALTVEVLQEDCEI